MHVRSKNDVAFTPFGMDVLPALGDLCKAVQTELEREKKALESTTPRFLTNSHATGQTQVSDKLAVLQGSAGLASLTELAVLDDGERERLNEIAVQLASDPRKTAKELRVRTGRIEALKRTLAVAEQALSDEAIAAIRAQATDASTKAEAAQVAASMGFNDEPLGGIGEPVWRELWKPPESTRPLCSLMLNIQSRTMKKPSASYVSNLYPMRRKIVLIALKGSCGMRVPSSHPQRLRRSTVRSLHSGG